MLLGGLYALFALGQSLMFGVMRLTNTAQGDFIVLAAFAAIAHRSPICRRRARGWRRCCCCRWPSRFGYALQRYVLNGTLGKDPLPSLVVTFGLSIVIQNLLLELFSADPRSIETGGFNTAEPRAGRVAVRSARCRWSIFGVALGATAALQWLFGRTALGPRLSRRVATTARSPS